MSRLTAVLLTLAALAFPTGVQAAQPPPSGLTLVVTGRGWGHGVGMSQYGARGFAEQGVGYAEIVAHYYPGTALGNAPVSRVRVLLAEAKKVLTVGSEARFRVRDGLGEVHELEAGAYAFGPGLRLPAGGAPQPLPGPLFFTPGDAALQLGEKRYRGTLEVAVAKQKLSAINGVGLEAYLYGVVPDEMPPDWAPEALKAQAVAARTYALAVRRTGPFDLYADVRSQVYGGMDSEDERATAAIKATVGQVVLHGTELATTFFFSTSGGRTAAIHDVWPRAEPTPYLVSVADPYDSLSPYHRWGPVTFTGTRLAKALRAKGGLRDVRITVNGSGRVGEVIGIGDEAEVRIPAGEVRAALGLRSTWFRTGVLAVDRPELPVVFGGRVKLTGVVRNLKGVTLERRAPLGDWEPVAEVTAARDGRFARLLKPLVGIDVRLVSGVVLGEPVRVRVAPRVRVEPPAGTPVLRGTVKPLLPSAAVTIQRQDGIVWTPIAEAAVDEAGAFEAAVELVPGTYRARVVAGRGFVPGFSPSVTVGGQ